MTYTWWIRRLRCSSQGNVEFVFHSLHRRRIFDTPGASAELISGKSSKIDYEMLQTQNRFTLNFPLGTLASVCIHVIVLALLIFGLPQSRLEPKEPEAIQVELVPPKEKPLLTPWNNWIWCWYTSKRRTKRGMVP